MSETSIKLPATLLRPQYMFDRGKTGQECKRSWVSYLDYLEQFFPEPTHFSDERGSAANMETTVNLLMRIQHSKALYAQHWWRESLYYWRTSIWNFMVKSKDFIKRCLIQIAHPFTYIANLFFPQHSRQEWILKLPNLIVRIYTWILVIPAWLLHVFLVFAFFYWGTDASTIDSKQTVDNLSLFEQMRQDINAMLYKPEVPLWFNAIGLIAIGILIIIALPLMVALFSVWWGILGLLTWGITGIIVWWIDSIFSRILSDRWQKVMFFFLCFIALLANGVVACAMAFESLVEHTNAQPFLMRNYFKAVLLEHYLLFGFLFWIPVLILCTMARSPLHKVSDWIVHRILQQPRKID